MCGGGAISNTRGCWLSVIGGVGGVGGVLSVTQGAVGHQLWGWGGGYYQ